MHSIFLIVRIPIRNICDYWGDFSENNILPYGYLTNFVMAIGMCGPSCNGESTCNLPCILVVPTYF